MKEKEQIIEAYFDAWISNNSSILSSLFGSDVIYIECYGPEYHGIEQIIQWFSNWHRKGSVMEWNIKQFIHQDNVVAVEWYFKCDYENNVDGFDGMSLITFNEENRMTSIKEFQSKALHHCPYESL